MIAISESGASFADNASGHPLGDPYVSPLFGDPAGFPPTVVQTGERDVMLSNAKGFFDKLNARGVPAQLYVRPQCPHGGFGGLTPEDNDARRVLKNFLLALWRYR